MKEKDDKIDFIKIIIKNLGSAKDKKMKRKTSHRRGENVCRTQGVVNKIKNSQNSTVNVGKGLNKHLIKKI